jgi:hypothetical protein
MMENSLDEHEKYSLKSFRRKLKDLYNNSVYFVPGGYHNQEKMVRESLKTETAEDIVKAAARLIKATIQNMFSLI